MSSEECQMKCDKDKNNILKFLFLMESLWELNYTLKLH